MTDLIPFIDPVSVAPHVPDAPDTPDAPTIKKVTITDRDDAYLAALLGDRIVGISIDKHALGLEHNLEFDVVFDGDNIFRFTPPVPTSTREWLLLALATKLQVLSTNLQNVGYKKSVNAPDKLKIDADLAAVIDGVNTIINALIEAGVFIKHASGQTK